MVLTLPPNRSADSLIPESYSSSFAKQDSLSISTFSFHEFYLFLSLQAPLRRAPNRSRSNEMAIAKSIGYTNCKKAERSSTSCAGRERNWHNPRLEVFWLT